jgi:hypothetical protein
VIVHLNFSQSIYAESSNSQTVLKLLVLFLYEDQTLISYEFHARPALELTFSSKKIDHVIYSRSNRSLHDKRARYFNRSNIIHEHPYKVRIEAYEIKKSEEAQLLAVWQYHVYFDYLSSFRLAKVLRLTKLNVHENPCMSNPCGYPQKCHQILNQKSGYICLCPSNFRGNNCSILDRMCSEEFCFPNALCRPNYRGLLTGNEIPYCICPIGTFGLRCELRHDQCDSNPCQNNGTCFPRSTPGEYFCSCESLYYGDQCEQQKEAVRLYINKTAEHRGAVVQYFDIDFISLSLVLIDQYSYRSLLNVLLYWHKGKTAPEIVLVKLYSGTQADIYLISVHMNVVSINGTTHVTDKTRCVDVRTLFQTEKGMLVHVKS